MHTKLLHPAQPASRIDSAPGPAASAESSPKAAPASVRLRGGLILTACAAVMLTAWWAKGLTMPDCSFRARTGMPCPSCGMTTSMWHMAHGRPWAAAKAQPFGLLLAAGVAAVGALGAAELALGRSLARFLRPRAWWVVVVVGGMTAGWLWKLAAERWCAG